MRPCILGETNWKAIAAESVKRAWELGTKEVILFNIPFGVNTGQADIYFNINLNPSTQFAIPSDESGDHADEIETSPMLHLRPDPPKKEAGLGKERKSKTQGIREGPARK